MPQIDLVVDFTNLESISKAHQAVVADYLMMRTDVGALAANFPYYFNRMPDTYAICFKQDVELVASEKHPGRYHCFIPDVSLGKGSFATVRKSICKVTLIPDPNNHGHFLLADPKLQSRAIKYLSLQSHEGSYEMASNAAVTEAKHMAMVAPVRLHHRIPAGESYSTTFVPRIIMNCYAGENLKALSEQTLRPNDFSLQTKCDLSISMLAKLMFLQQWLIHFDLKNLNMMGDLANRAINFVDFGFAKEITQSLIDIDSIGGSPRYTAPERLDSQTRIYPIAIDTFSVGVVIAELFVTDKGLRQEVVSPFLQGFCNYICENQEEEKPDPEKCLSYLRSLLLDLPCRKDVYMWNNASEDDLINALEKETLRRITSRPQHPRPKEYRIPYENELNDDQRQELTIIIMNLVVNEPSARATASEALNDFILFYLKKYPDDIETLKHRIQKQLLMAAVDVAIQKLKTEVYKKPFADISHEEKSKIVCIRAILEKLKQFRNQYTNESSEHRSASSSSESPALAQTIEALRKKVTKCFTLDNNALFAQDGFSSKFFNETSKFISGLFSRSSNPLRIAEQALQIIENANRMADEIFASMLSPRPQFSSS